MDLKDLNIIWGKVLDKAFITKKMISYELKKASSIKSYNPNNRSVYVVVEKEYAKKLIVSNAITIKREFNFVCDLLVDHFYVNDELIAQVEIKELMGTKINQNKVITEKVATKEPISQNKTQEDMLDAEFFVQKKEAKLLKKTKIVKLVFYSSSLNNSKEFFVKTNVYHRDYLKTISIIFFFTLIIPFIALIKYNKRKNVEKIVELELAELIAFGFKPQDEMTKAFIKTHHINIK